MAATQGKGATHIAARIQGRTSRQNPGQNSTSTLRQLQLTKTAARTHGYHIKLRPKPQVNTPSARILTTERMQLLAEDTADKERKAASSRDRSRYLQQQTNGCHKLEETPRFSYQYKRLRPHAKGTSTLS